MRQASPPRALSGAGTRLRERARLRVHAPPARPGRHQPVLVSVLVHGGLAAGLAGWMAFARPEAPHSPPVLALAPSPPPAAVRLRVPPLPALQPDAVEPAVEPVPLELPEPPETRFEAVAFLPRRPRARDFRLPRPPEPPVTPPTRPVAADRPAPPEIPPARPAVVPDRVEPTPIEGACPPPPYPRAAIRRGLDGVVRLEVEVDATGRVLDLTVVTSSGHPVLDEAAVRAVRDWRFRPALEGGRPVPGRRIVSIRYQFDSASRG